MIGKKGLFKKINAKIANSEVFEPKVVKQKYHSRSFKPLSVSYDTVERKIPSLIQLTNCAIQIEDATLREAKERIKAKVVQVYHKGPYGILTPLLEQEMKNGENRRRS